MPAAPVLKEADKSPPPPDPNGPIDLKMIRTASLIVDQSDAGKTLVVGRAMANGGGVDGLVVRLQRFPNGAILATVRKGIRTGVPGSGKDRYLLIQGEVECEVL